MANHVKFYRLDKLPNFAADGKHVGLFVYVPEYKLTNDWIQGYSATGWDGYYPISTTADNVLRGFKVPGGLWFGGRVGWEHLTNVGSGISWKEIYDWFDDYVAGEAEIFSAAELTGAEHGTEITIFDPVLDRTDGLHASTVGSDEHKFTVGDGALKIRGKGATDNNGQTPTLPEETTNDVHSANDVLSSTLILDDSLIWTPSGDAAPYGGTIGVRTKTTVTAENPVVTLQDITGLNGAMHLIGTLDASGQWPDQNTSIWYTGNNGATPTSSQTTQIHKGDTFIVTTTHNGPDGVTYEVGDTVFYYESDGNLVYKVVNQNITTGTQHGQHAPVDMPGGQGQLKAGKLVIATNTGITTSDAQISDFITDIETTQQIQDTAQETADEGETHETTYTVTTTITRPDGSDADSNPDTETDSHDIIFHSNNNSLTIKEGTGSSEQEHQIDFDLVWLTTMV